MKLTRDLSLTSAPIRPRNQWSPAPLFAGRAKGAWFDPSDKTTLWQDSAGTVPVTTDGQPVGRIRDLSGNGCHAIQTVSAARPVWRTAGGLSWIEFDGVDDCLIASTVNLGATSELGLFGGVRKLAGNNNGPVVELTSSFGNLGAFALIANDGSLANWGLKARPSASTSYRLTSSGFAETAVITGLWNFTVGSANLSDQLTVRRNGVPAAASGGGSAAGPFANAPLFIGRRNGTSLPWAGNLYGMLVVGRGVDAQEVAQAERWLAARTGVTL